MQIDQLFSVSGNGTQSRLGRGAGDEDRHLSRVVPRPPHHQAQFRGSVQGPANASLPRAHPWALRIELTPRGVTWLRYGILQGPPPEGLGQAPAGAESLRGGDMVSASSLCSDGS